MVKKICTPLRDNLPIIRCVCGAEIPLVQQVELMGRAIDIHVEEHRERASDPVEAEAMARRIEDHLIKQVLETAGKKSKRPRARQGIGSS